MIKRILFIATLSLLLSASLTFAQTKNPLTSSSTKIFPFKFFSAKFSDAKNERVNVYSETMIEKLVIATARVKEMADETAKNISKAEARGWKTEASAKKLGEAQKLLDTIDKQLANLPEKVRVSLSSTEPSSSFKEVRTEVKSIIENIRLAHSKVVESIRLLKAAGKEKNKLGSTNTSS